MMQVVRNKRSSRAFTLLEIMIVVVIMGMMAAIGLPSIINVLRENGMRKAVSNLQDVCFTARQDAIVSGHTTSVVFYPQQGRFGLGNVAAKAGVTKTNVHTGKVTASTLPKGIQFAMLDIYHKDYAESPWARVFFYPNGTADGTVIVLTGRGQQKKITIDYVTGSPKVSNLIQ